MYAWPSLRAASIISASVALPSLASVCICRSPRISWSVTSWGSSCAFASAISPRFSRISGGIQSRPSAAYTSCSVRPEMHFDPRNTPYSLSLSFLACAILRSSMLCACDPVKYCIAAPKPHGCTGVALRDDLRDLAELPKALDDRGGPGRGTGDHNVEVADRFLAASKAAGHLDLIDAAPPVGLQVFHDRSGILLGFVQHHALLRRRRGVGDAFADLLEQFGADAGQLRELPFFQCVLEISGAVHLQLLVKQLDPLGAETGDAQQVEESRRYRRYELLALGQGAGFHQRGDFFCDAAPDPRELGDVELTSRHELGDGIGVVRDGARGIAVGAHLERIARRDLEQIGDVTEEARNFCVLHERNRR